MKATDLIGGTLSFALGLTLFLLGAQSADQSGTKAANDAAVAREDLDRSQFMVQANMLNMDGLHASDRGQYTTARRHFEKALELYQRVYTEDEYPEGHPYLARTMANIGSVYSDLGDYPQAKRYTDQALTYFRSRHFKENYPETAYQTVLPIVLQLAGAISRHLGDYPEAMRYYRQARTVLERLYPKDRYPHGTAYHASNLSAVGYLYEAQENFAQAREQYQRALAMWEHLYPENEYSAGHSDLVKSLYQLGRLLLITDDYEGAVRYLERAHEMSFELAWEFIDGASESEALDFIYQNLRMPGLLVSAWSNTDRPVDTLYRHIWARRGLVQRIISRRQLRAAVSWQQSLQKLYEAYVHTRQAIAQLTLAPADPDPVRSTQRHARLRDLNRRKENLERKLARDVMPRWVGKGNRRDSRTHTNLIEKLPEGTAFVDIILHIELANDSVGELSNGHKGERKFGGLRFNAAYTAFVLVSGKPTVQVRLFEATYIDWHIISWRKNIAAREASLDPLMLRAMVWEPIEKHLPEAIHTVYICPDGRLSRIPWAALPGKERGTVLLEEYAIATVPHGQFLLDQLTEDPTRGSTTQESEESAVKETILIVGNISYDSKPSQVFEGVMRSVPRSTRATGWRPLPGTKREINSIQTLAEGKTLQRLDRQDANVAQVLEALPKVRWAHIATHGFFADREFRSVMQMDERIFGKGGGTFLGGDRPKVGLRNPLVLSGLVLAGANLRQLANDFGDTRWDEGILTAEAIAGLPLQDLYLVVLSACETGMGEVAGGEGVFGLQRAFHMAGTKNVMASLWKVDDIATAALMNVFYRKLWEEEKPPMVALREAQLMLYRHPHRIDPLARAQAVVMDDEAPAPGKEPSSTLLWASFVLSGAGGIGADRVGKLGDH